MEKQIIIENPWYGMINSPEQAKRRQARMKQDRKVWRKKKAVRRLKVLCGTLAVLAGMLGYGLLVM